MGIDLRTIYLNYALTDVVSLIVFGLLVLQTKKRFPGTTILLFSFVAHSLGDILISLQGVIPQWISISVANTLFFSTGIILLIGLEHFISKRGSQIHNYVLICLFFLVHSYFTFVEPNLAIRNLNISLAFLISFSQIAWLMLKRVPVERRMLTYFVGIISSIICLESIIRIVYFVINPPAESNYFQIGAAEAIFVLAFQMLFLLMTFGLALMFNRQLLIDIASQEEKFSKAFQHSPNAYIITQLSNGQIFDVNEGFPLISEYSVDEVKGKTTVDLNLWVNEEDRLSVVAELSDTGKVIGREILFRKKSGDIMTGLFSAEIITLNNEKCAITVINDISERKKTEEALLESETSLRKLNATKDKIFSIVAHDLRNPFFKMIGFSDLLKGDMKELDAVTIQNYAGIINSSAVQTFRLVENLLDWARMQQNNIQFNPKSFVLKDLVNEVTQLLKEDAAKKGIVLMNRVSDDLHVLADVNMLKSILRNLVSNGLKFTNIDGKVEIDAKMSENRIMITVKDNGIGINQQNIEKIFLENSNYTTRGTENEKGTGLGLMLCKGFVSRHGGEIWVESEEGKGSTFFFTIPVVC